MLFPSIYEGKWYRNNWIRDGWDDQEKGHPNFFNDFFHLTYSQAELDVV